MRKDFVKIASRAAAKDIKVPKVKRKKAPSFNKITIDFEKYKNDPVLFIEKELGITLWEKQKQIARALAGQINQYGRSDGGSVVCRASHTVGKTYVLGALVNWAFFCFDNSIGVLTAPTFDQAAGIGMKYARGFHARSGLPNCWKGPSAPHMETHDLHWFKAIASSSAAGIAGRHAPVVTVLVDESVGVDPELQEGIESLQAGERVHSLHLYNPIDPAAWVRQLERSPDWTLITISCLEHPNIAHGELMLSQGKDPKFELPFPGAIDLPTLQELLRANSKEILPSEFNPDLDIVMPGTGIVSDKLFIRPTANGQSRYLGIWPSVSATHVMSELLIRSTHKIIPNNNYEHVGIGVDVAREGDDNSVVAVMIGNHIYSLERIQSQKSTDVIPVVKRAAGVVSQITGIPAKDIVIGVDTIGYGGAIQELLEEDGYDAHDVNVSRGSSNPTKYFNLRTELIFKFKDAIEAESIAITDEDLLNRLVKDFIPQLYNYHGKAFKLKSKEAFKRTNKFSPDDGDAALLSYYAAHADEFQTWDSEVL